ncbi:hypothetical protein L596_017636 [Steinernema carpocapsae]|uniref:Uncharacterized protein n=1 Tax=Steinernema carpocapsae TaxID=34508 RepID=A0A4U5N324_STECR|nr:hypothetical protein L596_017636 [Steinernema carpocapsae]
MFKASSTISFQAILIAITAAESRFPCREPSSDCLDVPEPIVQKVPVVHNDDMCESCSKYPTPAARQNCYHNYKCNGFSDVESETRAPLGVMRFG